MPLCNRITTFLCKNRNYHGTKFFVFRRWFGQPAPETHPHLIQEGEVTPGIVKEEFRKRRHKLIQALANTETAQHFRRHIVVIPSATKLYMSQEIPYQFRQNTDFLYLCGFQEPDSLLILQSINNLAEYKSVLFVPKRDPARELWEGARSGADGATLLTGVDEAYSTDELGKYLNDYLQTDKPFIAWYDHKTPTHAMFHNKYLADFIVANKHGYTESPKSFIHKVRLIKSESEIKLMQKTCDIASNAFIEVMKFSKPGIPEAHIFAKMDYECRLNGAQYLAYPPVVAGGKRANTIHYISNNQIVEDGDMVLMDSGCEYHGYTSDITRTWPVSGVFTDGQRILYEALLEVQELCVRQCVVGSTLQENCNHMLEILGQQLQRIGIVSKSSKGISLLNMAREFCPHHVGHYLGMDVHDTDTVSGNIGLQPGMVVTVEPGIYIPQDKANIHAEFRGLGIRIEDDVLITDAGPHVLTSACPKHPDEITDIIKSR